jgi:hypothetical protein
MRRPAGPPSTRRPRAGQSKPRKMVACCPACTTISRSLSVAYCGKGAPAPGGRPQRRARWRARRGNFNKMSGWPQVVTLIGLPGLHFHNLRHTGNQFAANSGAGLKDLMARMGHDSVRTAMIDQHRARGADERITDAIDTHVHAEWPNNDDHGAADTYPSAG